MGRHGSGRADLVLSGGQDVVQDEPVSGRKPGDNPIVNPRKGTPCRDRTDISGMGGTRDILGGIRRDGGNCAKVESSGGGDGWSGGGSQTNVRL